MKIELDNGFEFEYKDGGWISKAIKSKPLAAKKIVKETPFFKVSEVIEKKYHQRFDRALVDGVKDIARYLTKQAYE